MGRAGVRNTGMASPRFYRISSRASDSRVADETVILHLGSDTYFGLDPVGTVIWEGLRQGLSTDAILARLTARFAGTEPARIARDMEAFLADLLAHDIIEPADDEG